MRAAVQRGDLEGGAKELNHLLDVKTSEHLPQKWKKNFALVVLERATVLQAMGLYELSARDYQAADKELELLDIARDGAGKIGKYIYSDSATKYKTSPTEKLALNAMNMCNYLARGDLNGAKIEARRFTVMRKYMRDYDPEHQHAAFGSYLAGFVYERMGDADEALRYYEEALADRDLATLQEPIERLAQRSTFRAERIDAYLPVELRSGFRPPSTAPEPPASGQPSSPEAEIRPAEAERDAEPLDERTETAAPEPETVEVQQPRGELGALPPGSGAWAAAQPAGEVLVVAKVGRVPFKVPERIPIGLAIGLAGAYITGDPTLLEYGMFKFVVYPELVGSGSMFESADLSIDGHRLGMDFATDLAAEIVDEYEELKPKIIGAALTRMIARAAAAEGARAAGRQSEKSGNLIGFLAAAAVEGTMVALDKPDTRSWTTLPGRVYIGRARLPAGQHEIEVTIGGPGGREVRHTTVNIPAGGFVVVDVTTLR